MFNCELTNNDDYRSKIFELLEDVLFVDGFDREGHPAPTDDDDDQDGQSLSDHVNSDAASCIAISLINSVFCLAQAV